MAWLQGLASLAGKSGGQTKYDEVGVSTPIQVNSVGLNLGSFLPSFDGSEPSGATPLFQPANQDTREQGTVTTDALPFNIPPIYLIGGFALLLLMKRGR